MKNEIQFDHSKPIMFEALGLTQERTEEIQNQVRHAKIDATLISEALEICIEKIKPQTPAEWWLIGYIMG